MKSKIISMVKYVLQTIVHISNKTKIGQYLHTEMVNKAMQQVSDVSHNGLKLKFSTPTFLNQFRIRTFSSKEPETLEWIDSIPEGAKLWDVGANVGLYSVYAAKKRNCKVWAFEPSVFNLELLARNIFLNEVTNQVCIVPLALSDSLQFSQMHMSSTDWGGALSTFSHDIGWDGKPIHQVFEYQIPGITMVDALNRLEIPQPDYIKMDVDGIEHLILQGGLPVIEKVKSVLVEVNDDFQEQAEKCNSLLCQAGLFLKEKRHSEMIDNSKSVFQNTYNQIWMRP
jgi:FkbM family methyltransferase